VSARDGGLSYRETIDFAGDCGYDRMIGIDLFSFSNCALVVVGSLRSAVIDGFDATSRRRGVDGGNECTEEGVVGVGMLVIEDCEECPPRRD
jgi:hypothetical protein